MGRRSVVGDNWAYQNRRPNPAQSQTPPKDFKHATLVWASQVTLVARGEDGLGTRWQHYTKEGFARLPAYSQLSLGRWFVSDDVMAVNADRTETRINEPVKLDTKTRVPSVPRGVGTIPRPIIGGVSGRVAEDGFVRFWLVFAIFCFAERDASSCSSPASRKKLIAAHFDHRMILWGDKMDRGGIVAGAAKRQRCARRATRPRALSLRRRGEKGQTRSVSKSSGYIGPTHPHLPGRS